MSSRKVTTRDLAAELQLSHSAVAAVLRGDRRTSPATRARVLAHAASRGYLPNPAATALAAQRGRVPGHPYNIGLLTAGRLAHPKLPLYLRCRERAAALGYGFEYLHLAAFQSPSQLARIVRARGIGGLVLDTLADGMQRLDPESLTVPLVKVHDGLPGLRADMVTFDQYRQTRMAFRMAWQRGHRRIGCTVPRTPLIASANQVRRSALLGLQQQHGLPLEADWLLETPHPLNQNGRKTVLHWIQTQRLDCVVLHAPSLIPWLRERGLLIPKKVGVLGLHIDPLQAERFDLPLAGFTLIPDRLADAAIRRLDSLIRQPASESSPNPLVLLVEPDWLDGASF